MATILESLKSVNAYPVPLRTLVEISERRGLSLTSEATQQICVERTINSPPPTSSCGCLSPRISVRAGSRIRSRTNSGSSSGTGLTLCSTSSGRRPRLFNPHTVTKVLDYDNRKRHNRNESKDGRKDRPENGLSVQAVRRFVGRPDSLSVLSKQVQQTRTGKRRTFHSSRVFGSD